MSFSLPAGTTIFTTSPAAIFQYLNTCSLPDSDRYNVPFTFSMVCRMVRLNPTLMTPLRGTSYISLDVPVYNFPPTVTPVNTGGVSGVVNSNFTGYDSTVMPLCVITVTLHSCVLMSALVAVTKPSLVAVPVTSGISSSAFFQGEASKVIYPLFAICSLICSALSVLPSQERVAMVGFFTVCGLNVTLKLRKFEPLTNSTFR